jgi:aspartyl-tRNA(Asn)/glutamyl-tRNA(Gln) amidotransferase subunit A
MLHIGPMARSVADVAITLAEIAGWDARDPASIYARYDPALIDDLSGWRMAWSPTLGLGKPNDEILAIVKNALASFTQAGCVIEEVGSIFDDPRVILPFEFFVGAAFRLKAVLQGDAGLLDADVAKQLRSASQFSADDVARAQSMRFAVREKMLDLFRNHRLLITPTVPVEAFSAERASPDDIDALPLNDWSYYTALHNLTGYPAISLPCGITRAGLPVGLQIIGGPHAEADVISAARRLERACDFRLPVLPN